MTKYQRAKYRISRDKAIKYEKQKNLYRINDDFNNVMTLQNMYRAFRYCRKGVGWKHSVQKYTNNAITELYNTYITLHNGVLNQQSDMKKITIYERGKKREILPICIKDRIPQRVLCEQSLIPVLRNKLIYDNGASIKGKGVSFTRNRLDKHLLKAIKEYGSEFYALVFDFKSFFDNISHQQCLNILQHYFNDKHIQGLSLAIIKSYEKNKINRIQDIREKERMLVKLKNNELSGVCLGSQISHIIALSIPNSLDHFIKDKCGIKHYIRYMYDGVIFHKSKEYLTRLLINMEMLCKKFGLHFNTKKTMIAKASKGFSFMKIKYRVTPTGKIVRKLSRQGIVRMRRKLKKFKALLIHGKVTLDDIYNSFQSWISITSKAISYKTKRSMLKLYNKLFDGYKITKKWTYFNNPKYTKNQSCFVWE